MLGFILLMSIGIFFYCWFIYPYAAKIERRQNLNRGVRWRRWMGREDNIEDVAWTGPPVRQAGEANNGESPAALPPPIDDTVADLPPVPVNQEHPFKPPR